MLLEYTVGDMMLKNMGNETDSDYAVMKVRKEIYKRCFSIFSQKTHVTNHRSRRTNIFFRLQGVTAFDKVGINEQDDIFTKDLSKFYCLSYTI